MNAARNNEWGLKHERSARNKEMILLFLISCLAIVSVATVNATQLVGIEKNASFKVNTGQKHRSYTDHHDVGMADNGDFVFTWTGAQGNGVADVMKRAFYADGTARDAAEVVVNAVENDGTNQLSTYIGMRANGTYDIAFSEYPYPVYTKIKGYHADGTVRYAETIVVDDVDPNTRSHIGMGVYDSGGAFILTTDVFKGYGTEVDVNGNVVFGGTSGTLYKSNAGPMSRADTESVAVASDGVAVMFGGGDGSHPTYKSGRYWIYDDDTGTISGGNDGFTAWITNNAFGVTGQTGYQAWHGEVALNSSGQGVMTWVINLDPNLNDAADADLDIVARRFSLSGTTLTFTDSSEWVVAGGTGHQLWPNVDIDEEGRFLISWSDENTGKLYGKVFNTDLTGPDAFVVADGGPDVYVWPEIAVRKNATCGMDFVICYGYNNGSVDELYAITGIASPPPAGTVFSIK